MMKKQERDEKMSTLSEYIEQERYEIPRRSLKAGLWMNECFDWYSEDDMMSHTENGIRTLVQSFTKQQVTYSRFTIKNTSNDYKCPKLFFHYENALERQVVAFFNPNEQAILHITPRSVALLGGYIKGKGISQYCIQGKGGLYEQGCFKSLKEGLLYYSPLAKGDVTSIFTLEANIVPYECVEAVAWVIHADTKEEAEFLNKQLLSAAREEF